MTHTFPHYETERQRSVNKIWLYILANQGFVSMDALITERLTASMANYATDRRKNTYSNIITVADCKTSKKRLLDVQYLISIIYHYLTVTTRTLYKSTDGPGGRPADNALNTAGLEDLHRTVPGVTVGVL